MGTARSSQDLKAVLEAKLPPLVRHVVESFGLAGLAIGIVKSGELVYTQGFGLRNLDTQEPVTSRTLFHLASVSKPFVATAIVQLVEQAKVALDAPIVTHLPFFRLLVLVPAEDAAVVVLANSNSAAIGSVTDAAVDILLEVEPQVPKPPITVPIGATLSAEGPQAAIEQYRRLITQPDRYDADPARFLDATWGAIELHRADVVMPLVKLWVTLQPDAALAYELLGWAYMVQGEQEVAAGNLRRALALDPEARHAEILLQRLSR